VVEFGSILKHCGRKDKKGVKEGGREVKIVAVRG
jgi:hypothetical protein